MMITRCTRNTRIWFAVVLAVSVVANAVRALSSVTVTRTFGFYSSTRTYTWDIPRDGDAAEIATSVSGEADRLRFDTTYDGSTDTHAYPVGGEAEGSRSVDLVYRFAADGTTTSLFNSAEPRVIVREQRL
jgi:hypothetical protein